MCRLETNFEKHLNTHGVTRRKDKIDNYMYVNEALKHGMSTDEHVSASQGTGVSHSLDLSDVDQTNTPSYDSHSASKTGGTVGSKGQISDSTITPDTELLITPEEGFEKAANHYFKDSNQDIYVCKICIENGEHFNTDKESVMQTHVFRHLNIFIYDCKFCGELFRSEQL